MAILNAKVDSAGQGQVPKFVYINTNDNGMEVQSIGYLNPLVAQGFALSESDMALVATRSTPSSTSVQCGLFDVERSVEGNWSLVAVGGGGGGITGAANLGSGEGIFASTLGSILQFKSLLAGDGINLEADGGDITINAAISGGDNIGTDAYKIFAGVSGTTMQFRSLVAGPGISMLEGSFDITIAVSSGTVDGAENLGVGAGLFAGQSGSVLQFKSLIAGSGISFIDAIDHVTISASGSAWDPDADWTVTGAWEASGVWHFSGGLSADIVSDDLRLDNAGGNVMLRSFFPTAQAIVLADTVRLTGSTYLEASVTPTHGLILNGVSGVTILTTGAAGNLSLNAGASILGFAPGGGYNWSCLNAFAVQATDFTATLSGIAIFNTSEFRVNVTAGSLFEMNSVGAITAQTLDADITLFSQGTGSINVVSQNAISVSAQAVIGFITPSLITMSADGGLVFGTSTGNISLGASTGTLSLESGIGQINVQFLTAGTADHVVYRDSVTGDLSSAPAGFVAVDVTGAGTVVLQTNHAYYVKSAGVVFNFPGTAGQGETYKIIGYGGGVWTVALQTGEDLRLGNTAATTSTGTMVATTNFDCVTIECAVVDTGYAVTSVIGTPNLT